MKIPYSMDDSEPDLYGGLGGHHSDEWETQTKWEGNSYSSDLDRAVEVFRHDLYVYTQADMTRVIQQNLKAVAEARQECYNSGYEDGYREGNLNCQHR